ncbi:DUF6894 family protein [Bradyrhizobium sp. CCBAU 45384]|uniref:DUF6894 family protein n=1 Tax=Bradyrhizobium sp. CCBAU 45384 TaxID=858428 RepID=UPI0023062676|nr:hypothetical protein [Bradyrhizobium sp. CCBAU 45384]MDA9406206.1 hypothetical protein [Bradyrhizobium sp. CCBAU 45384]
MKRYFFDIRDGEELALDGEGMMLPSIEAAQREAANSLADLARDMSRGAEMQHLSIEVRNAAGRVAEAHLDWIVRRLQ